MPAILALLIIIISVYFSGCANANYTNRQLDKSNINAPIADDVIEIEINGTVIQVEYADTPAERQLGLMYRRSLCENCGMLFRFDTSRIGSIWMKNTYIPLDLAYISEDGEIIDIRQLQPLDLTPVTSSQKVRFALEMNKGWFANKDIREGDFVKIKPSQQ